jgi:hypothetical protein
MVDHPTLTRCVGIAQVVAGVMWASREEQTLEK